MSIVSDVEREVKLNMPDRFMPHPIRDSIWLANGALAVAAGHAICLYTQTRPIAGDNNREGLFEYVARHNGPLEDYHPQMLLQCLLWGELLSYIDEDVYTLTNA